MNFKGLVCGSWSGSQRRKPNVWQMTEIPFLSRCFPFTLSHFHSFTLSHFHTFTFTLSLSQLHQPDNLWGLLLLGEELEDHRASKQSCPQVKNSSIHQIYICIHQIYTVFTKGSNCNLSPSLQRYRGHQFLPNEQRCQ